MDTALLQGLFGGDSGLQFVGGLVIAMVYATVGMVAAAGSILIAREVFQGRWEQYFWASFLIFIAAIYLSFAAYYGMSSDAWLTEFIGVGLFTACAIGGFFSRPTLAAGYVLHGLWDLMHSLSGTSLAGLSLTTIPLGYEVFCLAFDFTVAGYLIRSHAEWRAPGKFDPYFGRQGA